MTDIVTLAHISDVHLALDSRPHWGDMNVKRGLGLLNWQRKRRHIHSREVADLIAADAVSQKPDHIAVTGDLANIGLPAEYAAALSWLERLGAPDKVTVVPGNHDIYTRRMQGPSCLETWRAYMTPDAFGASLDPETKSAFPFVRRVGRIAIIGLNSAVPTPPFVAAGLLGEAQLEALARLLDKLAAAGLARLVLIHHPPLPGQTPPRRALGDAGKLARVLSRHGAELVLHGHNHVDMLAWRSAELGSMPVIGVASGSASRAHRKEPPARYNLLRLAVRDGGLEIDWCVRGLEPASGRIVDIARRQLTSSGPRDDQSRRASAGADGVR